MKKRDSKVAAVPDMERISWRVLRNGIYLCGGFDSLPVAKAFCHEPILFPSVGGSSGLPSTL